MPSLDLLLRPLRHMTGALAHLASPYQRYRHAQGLHALRVGLAMLTTILITSGLHIPHGDWASVSMLIVIGGIQHHGNIRKKAAERALGTALGAICGLSAILLHAAFGSEALTYGLISLIAGICGYYAIGRAGYIALLTAITLIIIAGHGDNSLETGMWRTLNVVIGIVVALLFSFALPLHAAYSWRYTMALNLRRCASLIERVLSGEQLDADARSALFVDLNKRSLALRNMLPSVAKELEIPQARLDVIQDLHRAILSALEMLSAAPFGQATGDRRQVMLSAFHGEGQHVRRVFLAMARALRVGDASRLARHDSAELLADPAEHGGPAALPPELQGPYWLLHQLIGQTDRMRRLLMTLRRAPRAGLGQPQPQSPPQP